MQNKIKTNRQTANIAVIALLTVLMALAVVFGGVSVTSARAETDWSELIPHDEYRCFDTVSIDGTTLSYSFKSDYVSDFKRQYYRLMELAIYVTSTTASCDDPYLLAAEYGGGKYYNLPMPEDVSGVQRIDLSQVLNFDDVFPTECVDYSCFLCAYIQTDDNFNYGEPCFIDFGYVPSAVFHYEFAEKSHFNSMKVIRSGNSLSHLQTVPVIIGDSELYYEAAETLTTFDVLTVVAGNPFASTDNYMSDSNIWGVIDGSPIGFDDIAFEVTTGSEPFASFGAVTSISEMLGYMREHVHEMFASRLEEILSSEYTFFFSKNDGTALTYALNVTPVTVRVPKKDGYTFVGWYTDEALTQPFNGACITADTTLYAKYAPNVCTVTYEVGAGTLAGEKTLTVDYGTSVTLPTPVCEGRRFLGWYLNGVKVETPYTVQDNVTLVAKWEVIKIKVTFIADGQVVSTVYVDYGKSLQELSEAEGLADCAFYSVDGVACNMEKPITEDMEVVIERHTIGGFIDGHMWVFWTAVGVLGAAILSTVIASVVAHKRR